MSSAIDQEWKQKVRALQREVEQLKVRVGALEEGDGSNDTSERIHDLESIKRFVEIHFPEAKTWQKGQDNRDLAMWIRNTLVAEDADISVPWPDARVRHFDAFVRRGQIIDFVRDVDADGILFDRLQWAVVGSYKEGEE